MVDVDADRDEDEDEDEESGRRRKKKGGKAIKCPFCAREGVPSGSKCCPFCSRELLAFCPKCGAKRQLEAEHIYCTGCGSPFTAHGSAVAAAARKCDICKADLAADAKSCRNCGKFSRPPTRLCPKCKKAVALTANRCSECGSSFPLSVDKFLSHVVCGGCHTVWEIDDWMARYNLPFLFQTPPREKELYCKSREAAVELCLYFFLAAGGSHSAVREMVEKGAEDPWQFRSWQRTVEFMNRFKCGCGVRNWNLSPLYALKGRTQQAAPHVGKAAAAAGSWLWGHFRQAGKDLTGKGKKTEGKK